MHPDLLHTCQKGQGIKHFTLHGPSLHGDLTCPVANGVLADHMPWWGAPYQRLILFQPA